MLDGLVALVTGAGSGLGAAISRRLATDGATVVVNDLRADAAEVTAKEVDGEAAPFDVSDSAAFDAAVDGVVARHGRIDIVVNNAGLLHDRPEVAERSMAALMTRLAGGAPEPVQALSTLSDELWDRMIKVHLYGAFYGTRAALRHMQPARRGSIVNISSILGQHPSAGAPHYATAKAAIIALTRSVAQETAHLGIRVNAVCPGYVDTPLLAPLDDALKAMITMQIASGRMARAEELAELVRFLAGPESSYSTGDVFTASGGYA